MTKSQFNIKISKELLVKIKRQAMMNGKSLTDHITYLINQSLSDESIQAKGNYSISRINDIEDRLLSLESIVQNREYISPNLKPFTNSEAINCTNFMKGLFDLEIEKRKFEDKNQAFDEFFKHVQTYVDLDQFHADRFKEIMINAKPNPWTGKELNAISSNDKCNCPIRKGLINWTGKRNCPSQQEICDKGEKLLSFV